MDGYLPGNLESMKEATLKLLAECEKKKMSYVTILFHDCYFCEEYKDLFQWYIWLIQYLKKNYMFISFMDAIRKMEG